MTNVPQITFDFGYNKYNSEKEIIPSERYNLNFTIPIDDVTYSLLFEKFENMLHSLGFEFPDQQLQMVPIMQQNTGAVDWQLHSDQFNKLSKQEVVESLSLITNNSYQKDPQIEW